MLVGTAAAVLWANLDFDRYAVVAHALHFCVNEIGMVFFFALAAKEVFEATLPGGSLASARRAFAPLAAAVGGMVAPALIFVGLASLRGPADLVRGCLIHRNSAHACGS
jgi:NhaA family Na+:H+ antiporter